MTNREVQPIIYQKEFFIFYDVNNTFNTTENQEIDLREVAPAILNYFDLEKKDYMPEPSFII